MYNFDFDIISIRLPRPWVHTKTILFQQYIFVWCRRRFRNKLETKAFSTSKWKVGSPASGYNNGALIEMLQSKNLETIFY